MVFQFIKQQQHKQLYFRSEWSKIRLLMLILLLLLFNFCLLIFNCLCFFIVLHCFFFVIQFYKRGSFITLFLFIVFCDKKRKAFKSFLELHFQPSIVEFSFAQLWFRIEETITLRLLVIDVQRWGGGSCYIWRANGSGNHEEA